MSGVGRQTVLMWWLVMLMQPAAQRRLGGGGSGTCVELRILVDSLHFAGSGSSKAVHLANWLQAYRCASWLATSIPLASWLAVSLPLANHRHTSGTRWAQQQPLNGVYSYAGRLWLWRSGVLAQRSVHSTN
jgi:hypothetical protein